MIQIKYVNVSVMFIGSGIYENVTNIIFRYCRAYPVYEIRKLGWNTLYSATIRMPRHAVEAFIRECKSLGAEANASRYLEDIV